MLTVGFSGYDLLGGEGDDAPKTIYPLYLDEDDNGINDYVEADHHDSGPSSKGRTADFNGMPMGPAPGGHAFVENNGDGICDYAQNGSATWHGPGFVDENGNGISAPGPAAASACWSTCAPRRPFSGA